MSAAFRETLVLELDHRGAGALEIAHSALYIERVAEPRVTIDNDARANTVRNAR